jgi:hypothetical protein
MSIAALILLHLRIIPQIEKGRYYTAFRFHSPLTSYYFLPFTTFFLAFFLVVGFFFLGGNGSGGNGIGGGIRPGIIPGGGISSSSIGGGILLAITSSPSCS